MESRGPELRKFVAPEVVFGVGSLHLAGQYGRNLGGSKALVVSDPGVVAAGWAQQVLASVERAGLASILYTQVTPNPRIDEAAALALQFELGHRNHPGNQSHRQRRNRTDVFTGGPQNPGGTELTIINAFVLTFVLQLSVVVAATLTGLTGPRKVTVAERDEMTPSAGRRGENSGRRL
jgi:hypothetical protein